MMIIIFWEVLIRATRCHLPEDDNHLIGFVINYFTIENKWSPQYIELFTI
jgi:hypothetical protein